VPVKCHYRDRLTKLFSWESCTSLPPSWWFRFYLLQRWLTVMNGHKCNGEQVEVQSAENRRKHVGCFATGLFRPSSSWSCPPALSRLRCCYTSFILGLRRDFTDRPVPFRAGVNGVVEKDEQAVTCNLVSSRCILTLRRSSFSIHVLVPNT